MITLSEIVNEEINLSDLISKPLKKLLSKSKVDLTTVNYEAYDLLNEIDLLIEEIFPKEEADEYKPSFIINFEENPLCIACLKNGIVIGSITATFDFNDNSVSLKSLAVDSKFQNQKIGSILMLALHDICNKLDITSISLISSSAGKAFYLSFEFTEMAHQSFERSIPFEEKLIKKKVSNINRDDPTEVLDGTVTSGEKRANESLINHSLFKPKEISTDHDKKREQNDNKGDKDKKRIKLITSNAARQGSC